MPDKPEPNPVVQKIVTALIGLGMIALAAYMFIEPASPLGGSDTTGRKTGLMVTVIDWLWGWPGGIVLGLLGLLIVASLFMKGDADGEDNAPASAD